MGVRLIFWGGARETNSDGSFRTIGVNDNSAFNFAALNIKKTYKSFGDEIVIHKIKTADDITRIIEARSINSIVSLDIISHGSPLSLNFSKKSYEACGFYASFWGKKRLNRITVMTMAPISSLWRRAQHPIFYGTGLQIMRVFSYMAALQQAIGLERRTVKKYFR